MGALKEMGAKTRPTSGHSPRRPRQALSAPPEETAVNDMIPPRLQNHVRALGPAVGLLLTVSLTLLVVPSASLQITPQNPPDGTWFPTSAAYLNGTAAQPGLGERIFGGPSEFLSGTFDGTTIEPGGAVQPNGSSIGQVEFAYDFSYPEGAAPWQEAHEWNPLVNGNDCNVTSEGSAILRGAPALACKATGALLSLHATAPRPIEVAIVTFRAGGEAGARWSVEVVPDSDPFTLSSGNPTFTAPGSGEANISMDVSGLLFGKTGLYLLLRAETTTGATANRVFADDLSVVLQLQPAAGANTYRYLDSFGDTANSTLPLAPPWRSNGTGWAWSGTANATTANTLRHVGAFSFINLHIVSAVDVLDGRVSFRWFCTDTPGLSDDIGLMATFSNNVSMPDILQHEENSVWGANFSAPLANYVGGPEMILKFYSQGSCMVDDLNLTLVLDSAVPVPVSGTYTSPPLDFTAAVVWERAYWDVEVPPRSGAVFDVRTSADGASWGAWSRTASGSALPFPPGRYLQFRASMWGDDAMGRPNLTQARIATSGITRVLASVDGGDTWQNFSFQGEPDPRTVRWEGTVQLPGAYNSVTLRVVDSSGDYSESTRQLNWDIFPPSPPPAPGGPTATNQTTIRWQWAAGVDEGLGVVEYRVRVGSTPGGFDLVDNESLGASREYLYAGAVHGLVYFASVQARDGAGLWSPWSPSSGAVYVDMEPPGPTTPTAPPWGNTSSIGWEWPTPLDNTTEVAGFLVWAGQSPGSSDAAPPAEVVANTFSLGPVLEGASYYLTVRARDRAGNLGEPTTSVASRVDLTPPTAFMVTSQPPAFFNLTTATWAWGAATDALSGVATYGFEAGRIQGASDLRAGLTPGTRSVTLDGLVDGTTVHFRVRACDMAGNCGPWVSAPEVGVDLTPPGLPTILGQPPPWTNLWVLEWMWSSAADGLSGVAEYLVSVGTTPGLGDVVPEALVGSATFARAGLTEGTAYYLSVRAVDRAGNVGPRATSASTQIDRTVPDMVAGLAPLGGHTARPYATITWDAGLDGGGGSLAWLEVEVTGGPSPGLFMVAGGGTSFVVNGSDGSNVTARVRGLDRAGNVGPWSSAASVVFDFSAPVPQGPLAATVLRAAEFVEWEADHEVVVEWEPFEEAITWLVAYRVDVGTAPGGSDVLSANVTDDLRLSFVGEGGATYYISVTAIDAVGNEATLNGPEGGVRVPSWADGVLTAIALAVGAALAVVGAVALRRRGRGTS